jgi:hypothetical protein
MRTTDAVEDDIHTRWRESLKFLDEILMLVIDRDTSQVTNRGRATG